MLTLDKNDIYADNWMIHPNSGVVKKSKFHSVQVRRRIAYSAVGILSVFFHIVSPRL